VATAHPSAAEGITEMKKAGFCSWQRILNKGTEGFNKRVGKKK